MVSTNRAKSQNIVPQDSELHQHYYYSIDKNHCTSTKGTFHISHAASVTETVVTYVQYTDLLQSRHTCNSQTVSEVWICNIRPNLAHVFITYRGVD